MPFKGKIKSGVIFFTKAFTYASAQCASGQHSFLKGFLLVKLKKGSFFCRFFKFPKSHCRKWTLQVALDRWGVWILSLSEKRKEFDLIVWTLFLKACRQSGNVLWVYWFWQDRAVRPTMCNGRFIPVIWKNRWEDVHNPGFKLIPHAKKRVRNWNGLERAPSHIVNVIRNTLTEWVDWTPTKLYQHSFAPGRFKCRFGTHVHALLSPTQWRTHGRTHSSHLFLSFFLFISFSLFSLSQFLSLSLYLFLSSQTTSSWRILQQQTLSCPWFARSNSPALRSSGILRRIQSPRRRLSARQEDVVSFPWRTFDTFAKSGPVRSYSWFVSSRSTQYKQHCRLSGKKDMIGLQGSEGSEHGEVRHFLGKNVQ